MTSSNTATPPSRPRLSKPPRPSPPPDRFHLLIDCVTEDAQRRLYDQLKSQGFSCRVLIL